MLKKILLIIFTIIVTKTFCLAYEPYLPKGSLIKVYTRIPITTEQLEEGSRVYFIVPSDVWVLEQKAIEKGDIFEGYVSMLKMPVQGVNAAMSITITNIIKTDGQNYNVKGRLIFSNSDILGGNLTNPASYNTTIHPRKVYGNIWGGSLQYVPSGEYEFGHHVGINSRDNIFVQIDEDYYI
ncbi:MAG: hypothetical protein IJ003_00130 [Candidatus Gastranaerophilales bacterium]|nr:hypothetical protein [Candidatus Gastranaerophilales bacterium]